MTIMTPQEREKRFRIIQAGQSSEFWKILKDSLLYVAGEKLKAQADLLHENKVEEAKMMEAEYRMLLYVAGEPSRIIQVNRSIFDEFFYETCKTCSSILKKFRPKQRAKSEEVETYA